MEKERARRYINDIDEKICEIRDNRKADLYGYEINMLTDLSGVLKVIIYNNDILEKVAECLWERNEEDE